MKCQKCNSEKIITLSSSGRQICQECQTTQQPKKTSGGASSLLFVLMFSIAPLLQLCSTLGDVQKQAMQNEKESIRETQALGNAGLEQQMMYEMVQQNSQRFYDHLNSSQQMAADIYSGQTDLIPLRQSIVGRCDCPYDIFYSQGQQRWCRELSAYVRTGGREPACFVGEF